LAGEIEEYFAMRRSISIPTVAAKTIILLHW
jgi:hypothetical protein